ncbi:unnamed protein product [Adineta steineri]|uniref:Uncharacterized protein n=1 Tax=Adineta steineri TaxID=433720 RepID=A0A818IYU9_9BILA|nr:unnamed protein product [Adineta steineri]
MLFLQFFWFLIFSFTFCRSEICTAENCLLPSCQCPVSNANPTTFDVIELPQFVLLTFVGNLNKNVLDPIRSILNTTYRNPNKCPISSTFFIHDLHTEYCLVQRLFDNHHEIAMTASSNKCPLTNCYNENDWVRWTNEDWQHEIEQQRINIVHQAQIDQSHIKGFRAPHLQIDQNRHLDLLQKFQFHYDSSMLFKASKLMWPFTLNYPVNFTNCVNCDTWAKPYEALWQFPLHEWNYPKSNTSCRSLSDSSCLPADKPHTADLLYNFLMHNFRRHSSLSIGRRAPFNIQIDLTWLSQNKQTRLQALIRFIEYITKSPDHRYVYFVSIEKALEWFKYPRVLHEMRDFWPFSCNDKIYGYNSVCSGTNSNDDEQEGEEEISRIESLKSNNKTNQTETENIDRQAEKLFPSSIAIHATWIFVVLIIGVYIYDKYFTKK